MILLAFILGVVAAVCMLAAYGHYADERDGNLSRMPLGLRFLMYPIILFGAVFFYALFFAITVWGITGVLDWLLNVTIYSIASLKEWTWLAIFWEVVGDVAAACVLVKGFAFMVTFIRFGAEKRFTFFYRLALLIPLTILMLCMIIIKPMSGHSWHDIALFSGAIVVGAAFALNIMVDELRR